MKKFHAFNVNGSKRFERQWDERVRLWKINVRIIIIIRSDGYYARGLIFIIIIFIIIIIIIIITIIIIIMIIIIYSIK